MLITLDNALSSSSSGCTPDPSGPGNQGPMRLMKELLVLLFCCQFRAILPFSQPLKGNTWIVLSNYWLHFTSLNHQFHIKMLAEGTIFCPSESSPSQSVIGLWPLQIISTLRGHMTWVSATSLGCHSRQGVSTPTGGTSCSVKLRQVLNKWGMCPPPHFIGLYAHCLHTLCHFAYNDHVSWEFIIPLSKMNSEVRYFAQAHTADNWDLRSELLSDSSTLMSFYKSSLPFLAQGWNHRRSLLDSKCLRAQTMAIVF